MRRGNIERIQVEGGGASGDDMIELHISVLYRQAISDVRGKNRKTMFMVFV